jgi:DNA-binding CsgD family transcriptional regulator/N-acetylneuraminic acid mutarotase
MAEDQETLSEREMEIIRLVATGATNREIARKLVISVNTVKVHLNRIFNKLNVASRTEAALYAVREGWVAVEGVPAPDAGLVESAAVEQPSGGLSLAKQVFFMLAAVVALLLVFLPQGSLGQTGPQISSAFTDRNVKALSPISRFQVYRWKSRARMPTPRGRLAVVAYDNAIYAVGGDTAEGVSGVVEVYDPERNLWRARNAKPSPVSNIGAAVIAGKMYVPGGALADGKVTARLEVYDIDQDTWEDRAPLPTPLCAYAIASVEGRLYLFGGWDGEKYLSSVYVYDPAEDRWRTKTAMPTARGFAGAGVIGGKVYVVGGYNEVHEFASCEEYDPAQDNGLDDPWTIKAPLTVERGGLGVVAVGDSLYALGGGWKGYLTSSERYDPTTDTWSSFESPVLIQWRNLGVAATETTIYAVGGWNSQYLSVNEEYQAIFRVFLPNVPSGESDSEGR